jgi:hypothetical protein
VYDYAAVISPQGALDPEENIFFDKDEIKRIYFIGYVDEQEGLLNERIDQWKENNQS